MLPGKEGVDYYMDSGGKLCLAFVAPAVVTLGLAQTNPNLYMYMNTKEPMVAKPNPNPNSSPIWRPLC